MVVASSRRAVAKELSALNYNLQLHIPQLCLCAQKKTGGLGIALGLGVALHTNHSL